MRCAVLSLSLLLTLSLPALAQPITSRFWEKSSYADENHPALSGEQIREHEARLGLVLPALFKRLYMIHNGGTTNLVLYPRSRTPEGRYPFVDAGRLEKLEDMESLKSFADVCSFGDPESDFSKIPGSDRLLVFARYGWECWLCLDYRMGKQPGVVLYETSYGPPKELLKVASFEEFIQGLTEDSETP